MIFVFFQAEDGIRYLVRSRGLGDVYKRQVFRRVPINPSYIKSDGSITSYAFCKKRDEDGLSVDLERLTSPAVSYTHLRAHETVLDLVCRLLLEKKKEQTKHTIISKWYQKKQVHIIRTQMSVT